MSESRTIGIFGAGWVGLVTGGCFAELGHNVIVRDVMRERIEALQAGKLPFHEAELPDVLERNRDRIRYTLDAEELAEADALFVCVQTPPTYSGDADLSFVWAALDDLPRVERRQILVMKSTVPVGTGDKVRAALEARELTSVGYVSNPEFLAEGRAVSDFLNPDRIVIGAYAEEDGALVEGLYAGIEAPVVRTDVASAEMIKLAANAFLMTRISFINEIANVCEAVGADVTEVARGVGLDHRLGPHFLRAGIGYGGSCLAGEETVLVRLAGRTWLSRLDDLYRELQDRPPLPLEVLSWRGGAPAFRPVSAVTRRESSETVEVQTKMGRRVVVTPDHPFVVSACSGPEVKTAAELETSDWIPLAQGADTETVPLRLDVLAGLAAAELSPSDVIVRPRPAALAALGARGIQRGLAPLDHPRGVVTRSHDILRSWALRLDEHEALGLPREGAMLGTARNGTYVPEAIEADAAFWHVVGLYVAGGHCTVDGGRRRLQWSFHPRDEADLVKEVFTLWKRLGVKATVRWGETTASVSVSSRLLAGWWLGVLGLGANCYEQRVPDALWSQSAAHKRALLAGMWRGDGSWSLVNHGPSVVLEYGTVSRRLADGMLRLLGELGIVARLKVGRTAKSTKDTYWLVISGAGQVESLLDFVRPSDRGFLEAQLAATRRIAPTGYRREGNGTVWARVVGVHSCARKSDVYSLEVPGAETFVTTGGMIVHNCFPKDSLALKQLASNSGYHFQLLSAVIEVNELQKRRVISKLEQHLGKLRGKKVALLGLAFKAGTNDMREAPSIVLASRLLAEGAEVRAWDPVAKPGELMKGAVLCESVLEAVSGADAAVIVTEWDELRGLPSEEVRAAMSRPLIVDGRNLLDPEEVRTAGFAYEGIGRPTSTFSALPETPEPEPRVRG